MFYCYLLIYIVLLVRKSLGSNQLFWRIINCRPLQKHRSRWNPVYFDKTDDKINKCGN